MKLSEYAQGSQVVNDAYAAMDYLNMLEAVAEASEPWKVRRILASDNSKSSVNHLLDFYSKEKTNTIQSSQKIIRDLFKQVLNEYVSEYYGINYNIDLSISFGATSMNISVLTYLKTIEYSSWSNMVEVTLDFELDEWLNQNIFKFIYVMINLQEGNNNISIKSGKNGGIAVYTRDKFALKIKHSFYSELKYLTENSTGNRKIDFAKILEIYERECC